LIARQAAPWTNLISLDNWLLDQSFLNHGLTIHLHLVTAAYTRKTTMNTAIPHLTSRSAYATLIGRLRREKPVTEHK
jgi:hypothetical protein